MTNASKLRKTNAMSRATSMYPSFTTSPPRHPQEGRRPHSSLSSIPRIGRAQNYRFAFQPICGTIARVDSRPATLRWWIALTLLLLVAFALRTSRLTEAPPGLTHDEASNGHDSAAILRGVHRIYFPVGYGHEPLYNYSVAGVTALLGQSVFALRITTVIWGMAQLVLTTALARRWWGRIAALTVAACYAVSFWSLMLARVGLRAPALPALLAGSALAFDHAMARRRRTWPSYILAGLLLGASLYTYMASRGMPLLYVVFAAALAITDRPRFRRTWPGVVLLLAVAGAVGAPLFLHLRAHPELEQRVAQLGSAIGELGAGNWRPLLENVRASLPLLLWRGDPFWLYNVAGRPGLEPLLALGFVAGLIICVAHLSNRRHLFVLVWLLGGVAPALIAPVAYNLLHAVAAMPAAFLIASRGFVCAWGWLRKVARRPQVLRYLTWAGTAAFALTGCLTAHAYFVTWGQHRDVRVAYHHHVAALGQHLDAEPRISHGSAVVITTLYPGEFHDPYAMEVALRRDDLSLRWADGNAALFVPLGPARLYVEPQSRPSSLLWDLLASDLVVDRVLDFRPTDLSPQIVGYRWDAPSTWRRLAATLTTSVALGAHDPAPSHASQTTTAPVAFGSTAALVGYRLIPEPDGSTTALTAWEVTSPTDREWVIFAHLLDAGGELLWQDDRLDAPSWQWRPGDRFVQIHRFAPSTGASAAAVALGLYARDDLTRLPVNSAGFGAAGPITRVLLPMENTSP